MFILIIYKGINPISICKDIKKIRKTIYRQPLIAENTAFKMLFETKYAKKQAYKTYIQDFQFVSFLFH